MNNALFNKIERLREELLYLEGNRAKFLKNMDASIDIKKTVERSVYLCAEIALDIADMAIAVRGLPKPSSYSDSIHKLGDYKLVPKSFARRFVYIAGLRNFLAHDYRIDTADSLIKFLQSGLKDMKEFIRFMEKA